MSSDVYLKIDGIDGESTDSEHEKWIEVLSFNHGISQPVSAPSGTGGRTVGKVDFQDFSIVKEVDNATPILYLHCCNGKHLKEIIVDCCLATEDKHVFYKYKMEDVIVSSVSCGGGGGGTKPTESVTFNFGKMTWEYTPIDDKGKPGTPLPRIWDLEKNEQG